MGRFTRGGSAPLSAVMFFLAVIFGFGAGTAAAQAAATVKVPVTFYDFHSDRSNPEFEQPHTGGLRTGMVAATLDADDKPALGATPYRNYGIAHWFRDWNTYTAGPYSKGKNRAPKYDPTPGIRQTSANEWSATVTLVEQNAAVGHDTAFKNIVVRDSLIFTLANEATGTYAFSRTGTNGFFPLDGKGFGNEWMSEATTATHNYAFTMELAFQFQVRPGQSFSFSGDDDVWVFIDKQLVLDIGGLHEQLSGAFLVDTVKAVADGGVHTLRVFYAERHSTASNLVIQTNIVAPPPTYTLRYRAGAGGYIATGDTLQTDIKEGGSGKRVVALNNDGYEFSMWSDGVTSLARTDVNVMSDKILTAYFCVEGNTKSLNYKVGPGGSIRGPANQKVCGGSSGLSVTAVPDTGYNFVEWSDGITTPTRTEASVTEDAEFTASFRIKSYTLIYIAGENGTLIGGEEPQVVTHGSNGSLVVALPNEGYEFVEWSDGVKESRRTDKIVKSNISVVALFDTLKHSVTYYVNPKYGELAGPAAQRVAHGANAGTVYVMGTSGYTFFEWSDGSKDSIRTDRNVTADIAVTAKFKDANGKISVAAQDREIPNPAPETLSALAPAAITAWGELTAGPNPAGKQSEGLNFFWHGKAIKNSTLYVYDASGNSINKINLRDKAAAGNGKRTVGSWNLKDKKGRRVSEGTYLVKGTIKTSDGKKENVSLAVGVR